MLRGGHFAARNFFLIFPKQQQQQQVALRLGAGTLAGTLGGTRLIFAANRSWSTAAKIAQESSVDPFDRSSEPSLGHPAASTNASELQMAMQQCRAESSWRALQALSTGNGGNDINLKYTASSSDESSMHSDFVISENVPNGQLLDLIQVIGEFGIRNHENRQRVRLLSATLRSRHLSMEDYNSLVQRLAKTFYFEWMDEALEEMDGLNVPATADTYNECIRALVSNKQIERALELFKSNQFMDYQLQPASYSSFIRGFSAIGDLNSAKTFLQRKQQLGMPPDDADYNCILKSMFDMKMVEEAEQWFASMRDEIQLPLSTRTFENMIRGYAQNDNPTMAESWFKLYQEAFPNETSSVAWNNMLWAYSRVGNTDASVELFRRMQKSQSPPPDVISCNLLLHGFVKSNDVMTAQAIFREMENQGFHPNSHSYAILINGLVKSKKLDIATSLLEEMRKKDVAPTQHAYSVIMDGFSKSGRYDVALELFQEMQDIGIPLDIVSLTVLLFGSAKFNRFEKTIDLYEQIKEHKLEMTNYTYTALMFAYGKQNDTERVLHLLDEMKSQEVPRTIHTYNAILAAYIHAGEPEKARDVLQQVKAEQLQPTVGTYTLLMEIASLEDRCDNVLKLLNILIKDENLKEIDNHTLATAIRILGKHGHIDTMKVTFHALCVGQKRGKIQLDGRPWNRYIEALLRHEDVEEAKKAAFDMVESFKDRLDEETLKFLFGPFKMYDQWTVVEELVKKLENEHPNLWLNQSHSKMTHEHDDPLDLTNLQVANRLFSAHESSDHSEPNPRSPPTSK